MSTFDKVQAIIVEKLGVPKEKVVLDAEFIGDLGADSLDTVEFIMDVEKEFNITIPDDAATKMKTVRDAVEYIDAHAKKIAPAAEAKKAA